MSPGYDLSRRAPRSSRLSVDELSQASKLRAENSSLRLITGLEETLALETMGHQVIETGPLLSDGPIPSQVGELTKVIISG